MKLLQHQPYYQECKKGDREDRMRQVHSGEVRMITELVTDASQVRPWMELRDSRYRDGRVGYTRLSDDLWWGRSYNE